MPNSRRAAAAQRFSREARLFVAWADGSAATGPLGVPVALRRVVTLYAAALELPQPWSHGVKASAEFAAAAGHRLYAVRTRAAAIPLQHYSEIFSPLLQADAPVVGELADDLVEIYRDVYAGLALYEAGRSEDALWQWGFHFQTHWGEHASSAIRALHGYLAREDPSALSAAA